MFGSSRSCELCWIRSTQCLTKSVHDNQRLIQQVALARATNARLMSALYSIIPPLLLLLQSLLLHQRLRCN